jgi:hypothetical protein
MGGCCSVKPDETREFIWLVPTKDFADLLLSLVSLRLTERAARTRSLHCWNVRANGSETSWLLKRLLRVFLLLSCCEPNIETAFNHSCAITIVGYHGDPVYQVVASIPDWLACGGFVWKAPTALFETPCITVEVTLNCKYPR